MTHRIEHQYDEILPAAWPGLEIHIVYYCESEIVIDDEGEHEPKVIEIVARLGGNGVYAERITDDVIPVPKETDGQDAKRFLALLRESARQALWAKAIEAAKEAGFTDPQEINFAAENWQRMGKAVLVLERGLSTDND